MADGNFASKVSATRTDNAATNPIYVQLTDGSAVIGVTSGALDVNIASGSINIASDIVDDSAFTVGTDSVGVAGFLADETTPDSVDEGDAGAARMTLDRKQLIVVTDATTDSQRLAINASGEVGVVQATHDDLNANVNLQVGDTDVGTTTPVPVSATTAQNTETNPIFVQQVTTGTSGVEVQ